MRTLSRILLCIVFASRLWGQCNPSYDPDCLGGGDELGPDVGFTPDGGSYTVASGATQDVSVSISFSDADGLRQETLKILRWNNGTSTPVTGFTWTPNGNGTFSLARGTLRLTSVGETILTAEISDLAGKIGSGRASFRLAYTDPNVPVVSLAPHHDAFRDTSLGAAVLTYTMPAYTSLDEPRALGLYYNSERADPSGFVQLDVTTGPTIQAVTLQIIDQATNAAVTSEDAWARDPSGRQRLGARWSMRDRPSGAYLFWADVRAYQNASTTPQLTRVPFRVLVVNERQSRYGAGWSFAGIQRMHPASAGLLVDEGNGLARYFVKEGCTSSGCTFKTPAGDFSRMEYVQATGTYVRTYVDGTKVTFSTAGMMTSISNRFGHTTSYQWVFSSPVWLLAKVTDPAQINTWFEYYDGFVKAIIDPAARRVEMSYTGGNLTQIAGPSNFAAQYDPSGRVSAYTDSRGTWDIAYDAFGAMRQRTAPAVVVASGATVRPTTTFRSLQSVTALGSWVTHICCNWAAPVPVNAVMTAVTDALGHTTQTMLDRYGQPMKVIDVAGRTVERTYNEHGLPTASNDGSHFVSSTWNDRGQLLSRSVNGAVVYHASYTSGDQPEFEMSAGVATWYSYGAHGEVLRSWYGTRDDATRNGTTYEYDASFRRIASVGPKGERTEWSYAGNPWLNTSEERVVRVDGTRLTTATTYDGMGRPYKVTNPLAQTTTTSYDALNRTIKIVDALSQPSTFGYTGPDLITVTIGGRTHRYTWNALGWLTQETFPDGKTRRYAYDADGLRVSTTDRRNATITVTYDGGHRVTSRVADGVTTGFSYPDINTVVMSNEETTETVRMHPEAAGRLHRATFALGGPSSASAYEVERLLDPSNGWRQFGVDVKRLQSGSPLSTSSIRFTPDPQPADPAFGSLLSVRDFSGNTTVVGYDSAGQHTRTTFPNGVTQNHWYYADGRLYGTTFSTGNANDALGADYAYDALDRLANRNAADGKTRASYGYDAAGRLSMYQVAELKPVAWCNPSYETCDTMWETTRINDYTYDAAGNRTDSGATLQPNSNRYATFSGFTMEYDAEGNLTRKSKAGFDQRLTWSTLRRLTSVTTNGTVVTYGYTPTGRRIRRTAGGQTVYSIYDDDDLIMEVDAQGNPIRSYTHLPGVDQPLSVKTGSGAFYYTMEAPGHVTGLLNASGAVAGRHRFGPFGEVESSTDSTGQPLRFMSRELDAGTSLYYVRNRWYDPSLARFVSEDPIGLAGGLNAYAYVGNDPVNRRDPSGLHWECYRGTDEDGENMAICYHYNWGMAFGPLDASYGTIRDRVFQGFLIGFERIPADFGPAGLQAKRRKLLRPLDKPEAPRRGPNLDCSMQPWDPALQTSVTMITGEAGFLSYPATFAALSGGATSPCSSD